jgi:hypothetical protein
MDVEMTSRDEDPRLTTPSAVQFARFRVRQRRLDAVLALVAVFWLAASSLAEFLSDFRLVAVVAGLVAIGVSWWALRRGNGRVADKVLAGMLGGDRE